MLLIYRDPDLYPAGAQALKTIVVYDGVHIQAPDEPTVQTIGGFLQSSLPPSVADAGVTIIAGSGAPNDTDRILFTNGELSDFSSTTTPIGADQFFRISGGSSDRGWSSPTNPVGLLMPGTNNGNGFGEQVTVAVDHLNTSPYDCLATAAIVFSTNVEDADDDGLNDFLEANAGLMNPARVPYPDISLMGASPGQRDLFVEIGAMWSDGWNPATSGQDPTPGPHNHMPSEAILQTVADAFMNPPVGHEPIHLHFDVGDMAAPPRTIQTCSFRRAWPEAESGLRKWCAWKIPRPPRQTADSRVSRRRLGPPVSTSLRSHQSMSSAMNCLTPTESGGARIRCLGHRMIPTTAEDDST